MSLTLAVDDIDENVNDDDGASPADARTEEAKQWNIKQWPKFMDSLDGFKRDGQKEGDFKFFII